MIDSTRLTRRNAKWRSSLLGQDDPPDSFTLAAHVTVTSVPIAYIELQAYPRIWSNKSRSQLANRPRTDSDGAPKDACVALRRPKMLTRGLCGAPRAAENPGDRRHS